MWFELIWVFKNSFAYKVFQIVTWLIKTIKQKFFIFICFIQEAYVVSSIRYPCTGGGLTGNTKLQHKHSRLFWHNSIHSISEFSLVMVYLVQPIGNTRCGVVQKIYISNEWCSPMFKNQYNGTRYVTPNNTECWDNNRVISPVLASKFQQPISKELLH